MGETRYEHESLFGILIEMEFKLLRIRAAILIHEI